MIALVLQSQVAAAFAVCPCSRHAFHPSLRTAASWVRLREARGWHVAGAASGGGGGGRRRTRSCARAWWRWRRRCKRTGC